MDAATMLFLKRNENTLQLTADDVNFLSQPKHADEMCDHKRVACSTEVGKVQAGQLVCKTQTEHNFGDLLHLGCVHGATAPGAVWAAAWAGISQRCLHNRALALQMRLQKSKGELIWPPASEAEESHHIWQIRTRLLSAYMRTHEDASLLLAYLLRRTRPNINNSSIKYVWCKIFIRYYCRY